MHTAIRMHYLVQQQQQHVQQQQQHVQCFAFALLAL
jgi:hypothetical protein